MFIPASNRKHNWSDFTLIVATFRHLPHQRKMNVEQKEQVKTMLQMKANKKLVQQHIRKEMGQFVLLKDLHNMCGKEKGAPAVNLEAIVNELRQSEDTVVEVVEKEGVLQALFYQRKGWQLTYCQYPEVILIDATYKLNDLRMPLYLMLCVDGNGESEVVAMWLVSSEDKLTMKAMIGCFKKHNNAEKTTCVMAYKVWVERDVIVEELPHATLLICLFHVLSTFRREVSERGMGITQDQRHQALELLEKLAYSANEVEYCINRDALFALGLTKVFNYFLKQWDGIRHQWVEGLKNNAKHLLNNTNNRLESINQKIKDVVGRRLDLLQFFRELLKYFDSMSQERDHRAAMVFAKVPADLHRSNPLVSYQQHLTPYAFSAVKKQYEQSRGIAIPEGSGTTMRMDSSPSPPLPPTVSVGNVGQLAADLIVSTLWMERVGYILHPSLLPVVGNNPFAHEDATSCKMTTCCEVYESILAQVVVIQQRAPFVKGRRKEYARWLSQWIKDNKFFQVVLLTSTFAQERLDHQIQSSPFRILTSPSMETKSGDFFANKMGWTALEPRHQPIPTPSTDQQQLGENGYKDKLLFMPGSGIAKDVFESCQDLSMLVLMMFVSEGDNGQDALAMADQLSSWLNLIVKKEDGKEEQTMTQSKDVAKGISKWKVPMSWRFVFGSKFDQKLFQ